MHRLSALLDSEVSAYGHGEDGGYAHGYAEAMRDFSRFPLLSHSDASRFPGSHLSEPPRFAMSSHHDSTRFSMPGHHEPPRLALHSPLAIPSSLSMSSSTSGHPDARFHDPTRGLSMADPARLTLADATRLTMADPSRLTMSDVRQMSDPSLLPMSVPFAVPPRASIPRPPDLLGAAHLLDASMKKHDDAIRAAAVIRYPNNNRQWPTRAYELYI